MELSNNARFLRDRRSVRIRATEKGTSLCASLVEMESRHAGALNAEDKTLGAVWLLLHGFERVRSDDIQFG
ncbi:MAG: hypothetical protein ACPGQM_08480 [Alphaproteobacteria bacterium]